MAKFGDDFDAAEFAAAAGSADLDRVNQVHAVERGFEVLANYLTELAQLGLAYARVAEGEAGARSTGGDEFTRLRDAGVITARQAEQLARVVVIRNHVQHGYTNLDPGETRKGTLMLLAELGDFVNRHERWLQSLDQDG